MPAHLSSSSADENKRRPDVPGSALTASLSPRCRIRRGDITPKTDLARIIVSIQMLLDLVIIGAVVRLLFNAAQAGLARARGSADQS